MQHPLARIFNDTAAAAYKAFPQQLARLVVLVVPDAEMPVYISPQVAEELTRSISPLGRALKKLTGKTPSPLQALELLAGADPQTALKRSIRKIERRMRADHASGYAQRNYKVAGLPVNLIGLHSENILGIFSGRYTKEMQAVFTLDHEIGHLVLRNGFASDAHKAESAAEAFAMLRHIQRYGKDTDQLGDMAGRVAASIVLFSDTEHYTTEAVQRAIKKADELGESFFRLSLFDTARLAEDIGDACASDISLIKIRDAYLPVAQVCETRLGPLMDVGRKICNEDPAAYALFCRETVAVMRRYQHDPDIFRAGQQFLSWPPVQKFMTQAAQTSDDWKQALVFINTHHNTQPPKTQPDPAPPI